MNPLLQRQVHTHAPDIDESSEAWRSFLTAISATYDEFQREQRHLEDVLAVTADELTAANERSRHEAESQLAALHQRFEQTLESQQGMIVCAHRSDRGFVITLCRGELARRIGLTPESTEGRLLTELAAPENLAELTAAYERAWAGEEFSFGYTNARAGIELFGHIRPRREQGVVREIIVSYAEITALRHAEAKLQELNLHLEQLVLERTRELADSEARFRFLFTQAPDAIFVHDVDSGRIVDYNENFLRLFECTAADMREHRRGFFTPEFQPDGRRSSDTSDAAIERALAGESVSYEWTYRTKRDRLITCTVQLARLPTPGRRLLRGSVIDITARKDSERARDHLLALTRATLESTADGILVVDTEGRSQTFNRVFAAMWPLSADVVTLRDDDPALRAALDQLTEPEKFLEKIRALHAQPLAQSFDTLQFKDGRIFERSSRPLVVHGEPAGRVWIFHDVTERMRAEQALADAHRHASVLAQLGRELAEADTPRAAALAILEAARQLIGWDASWIEFWDEEKQAFKNPVNFDLIDGERREVPTQPISMATVSPAVRTAMQEGAYLHLRENEMDGVADSHLFGSGRRSLSRMFVPIRRADRLLGVLSIQSYRHHAYDQAALELLQTLAHHCAGALVRVQARAALTESETRFRLVWERTADGMRLTDPDGRVVAANDAYCRMVGRPRGEVEGELFTTPFAESIRAGFLARHRARFTRREPRTPVELQVELSDGRALWVEVSECFIESDPAHPLLLGIIRDVTARVRAESERAALEESLRQSQKMESLGTLAGGIAHDFNNILTGMFGFIELARHDLPPAHPAQESLRQVLVSGHRAKDLVRQILAFSRHQQGERLAVLLPPVIAEAVKLLRSTLPAKVDLDTRLDHTCPPILADASQIHQIVVNLCTNAWHALPERGGRIFITLEPATVPPEIAHTHPRLKDKPAVCLTVVDNGAGIAPEVLPRIFEPFFTTKEVGKGTGLGLAVVHGIVGAHDGAITVQSVLGTGTAFRLFFPALTATPAAPAPVLPAAPRGAGQHLLWIDDDPATNLAIEKTLVSLGYRVTACQRAADAIEKFCAAPADFALVLTDLAMPEISGEEVVTTLRRFAPAVPMLVITGFIEPRERAALLQLGVGDVLHKPLTRAELAAAVARHLAPA